jgi:hypothetical protein
VVTALSVELGTRWLVMMALKVEIDTLGLVEVVRAGLSVEVDALGLASVCLSVEADTQWWW